MDPRRGKQGVTLETFFEKFDLFADAPNAVAKMRELVLQLAVQGKLVEQNPAEGDGHVLLNQILVKNPPSSADAKAETVDSESPSIPSSWALSGLGEVAEIIRGVSFPGSAKSETRSDGDVACLRTASVQAEIDWDDLIFISPTHVSRSDQWVAPNDIIISMANSYALVGKVAIVRQLPQKATFGAFLAAIRPILIEPYFLLYVLRSPRMQAAFRASSSQTTNIANISLGRMRPLPFPLPPLAEQKRIVAKVDELMALCDRLEAQQQERETRHGALSRASLARFAEATTPANLNLLFRNSFAIPPADLRKSILTLAVQGKLVPQDPKDEHVEHLLARNDERRRETARSDRRADIYPQPLLSSDDRWEIADTWSWRALADLVLFVDYRGMTPAKLSSGVRLLTAKNVRKGQIKLSPEEFLSEPDYHKWMTRGFPKAGDVLFTTEAPMGNAAVVELIERFALAQRVICFQSYGAVDSSFLVIQILSDQFQFILDKNGTGVTAKGIKASKLKQLPIAVPPLAEQRRIVAKLEQLMALVDQLETQLVASRATAEQLMEALAAELTAQE
jgi:type I restriction enzyme S subunit